MPMLISVMQSFPAQSLRRARSTVGQLAAGCCFCRARWTCTSFILLSWCQSVHELVDVSQLCIPIQDLPVCATFVLGAAPADNGRLLLLGLAEETFTLGRMASPAVRGK